MKIYCVSKESKESIVWLFGSGLIGGSINRILKINNFYESSNVDIPWGDLDKVNVTAKEIIKNTMALSRGKSKVKVVIVWTAGGAGFYSNTEDTVDEYLFFQKLVDILTIESSIFLFNFIFFSSAGALYEGRIGISYDTDTCVKRPYGKLKIKQEKYLKLNKKISLLILRPSSVYGFIDSKISRSSLISTVVYNALSNRLSTLYGNLYTLRNYIWVEDVANFVLSKILNFESGMCILVGSRSYSIIEVKKEIEKAVRKKVYFKISTLMDNESDIVFSNNISLLGHMNTTVSEGVHKIMEKWTR